MLRLVHVDFCLVREDDKERFINVVNLEPAVFSNGYHSLRLRVNLRGGLQSEGLITHLSLTEVAIAHYTLSINCLPHGSSVVSISHGAVREQ